MKILSQIFKHYEAELSRMKNAVGFFLLSMNFDYSFFNKTEHKNVLGLTARLRAGQRERQIERWRVHGCLHHNKQVLCTYKSMHKHTLICMHTSTHTESEVLTCHSQRDSE